MKKIFLLLVVLVLFPINCFAEYRGIGIYDGTIKGPKTVKEGESFEVEIGGIYSGLNQNVYGVDGIFESRVVLEFDEDILEVTELYTDGYDSVIVDTDEGYVISSVVDSTDNNKCVDKFLDCTSYSARVVFFVKDTDSKEVKIKLKGLSFETFAVRFDRDYDVDDIKEVSYDKEKEISVKINQSSDEFDVPNSIVSDELPVINNRLINRCLENNENEAVSLEEAGEYNDNSSDSGSIFLKSLKIKGQKINFKSDKSTYEIVLADNINKLVVDAEPYVSDAVVKIIGADDLKSYSDIVKIRVELPNNEKMTYIINIKREHLTSRESSGIINKLNYVAFSALGIVLFIVVISLINSARDKRKLRELLEDEENEIF